MTRFEVILGSITIAIIWTLTALVNFTGWPVSDHPAAVSTDRAIIATIGMAGIFTLVIALIPWSNRRMRRRVAHCAHTRVRTVCIDCGIVIHQMTRET